MQLDLMLQLQPMQPMSWPSLIFLLSFSFYFYPSFLFFQTHSFYVTPPQIQKIPRFMNSKYIFLLLFRLPLTKVPKYFSFFHFLFYLIPLLTLSVSFIPRQHSNIYHQSCHARSLFLFSFSLIYTNTVSFYSTIRGPLLLN